MNISIPKNLNQLCRICLSISEEGSFKNTLFENGKSTELGRIIDKLNIKIINEDCMPINVCNQCKIKCLELYNFKNKIEQNEKLLYTRLKGKVYKCANCSVTSNSLYKYYQHNMQHPPTTLFEMCYHSPLDQKTRLHRDLDTTEIIEHRKSHQESILDEETFCDKGKYKLDSHIASIARHNDLIHKCNKTATHNCEVAPSKDINKVENEIVTHNVNIVQTKVNNEDSVNDECQMCKVKFLNKMQRELHYLTHVLSLDGRFEHKLSFCEKCGVMLNKNLSSEDLHETNDSLTCGHMFSSDVNRVMLEDSLMTCAICGQAFNSISHLVHHSIKYLLNKHGCPGCNSEFITLEALKQHVAVHPKLYKFACSLCKGTFTNVSLMRKHFKKLHSEHKTNGQICSQIFSTSVRFDSHTGKLLAKKLYICYFCNFTSFSFNNYKSHYRLHTKEKRYRCSFNDCDKEFEAHTHLYEHVKRHLNMKDQICPVCDVRFISPHNLKLHMRMHTDERPYKCPYCTATFRRKHHVAVHLKGKHRIV